MTTRGATTPELLCYNMLVELGYSEPEDFTFQTNVFGGRFTRGGQVVDFMFTNPPGLAFSVLGEYYHYRLQGGSTVTDLAAREELALIGVNLVFLDEDDLMTRTRWIVTEALEGRDHSKRARS